jgi:hypothetical protein
LGGFRAILADSPPELSVREAVHSGVVEFNNFPDTAQRQHRERMRLILETPALQAHSVHRYAQWRAAIAEYVAPRLCLEAVELLPQTIGQLFLAVALSAYEQWLQRPQSSITAILDEAMNGLIGVFR